jgi:uncharacterized delta-60 repeat protein
MSLTTRQGKGSKLTIQEMDGNLTYLEQLAQSGGGGSSYYNNGNSSENTEIDWSKASLQEIAIDNNPTLSFTGAEVGQKLTMLLSREVGKSRTITWSDGIFWKDGEEFDLKAVGGVVFDEGFDIGDGFEDPVFSLVIQPDGKILVGGQFEDFNGNRVNYLVRLNADGSLDEGFDIGDGFSSTVESIALQPDGKILAGGGFSSFDGNYSNNYLVRLNADGSLDEGFDIGDGFNSIVRTIALQPDGKILLGGRFSSYDGSFARGLVRLNADGSLDEGFDIGDGFQPGVQSIVLQPDGKILVGGGFLAFDDNYSNNRLVRLNADGSLDEGFDIGDGFNRQVKSIALQPDGKILVGGEFFSFDGNSANRLVRLNTDGSLDEGFDIGDGFNSAVLTIVLQSDGKILVGGLFNSFNGNTANNLARLSFISGDVYTPVNIYYTGTRYIGEY